MALIDYTIIIIDRKEIVVSNKRLLGSLIEPFVPEFKYMSPHAIADLIKQSIELCMELKIKGMRLGGLIATCDRIIARIENAENESLRAMYAKLLTDYAVNIVLRADGMGPLPGFGMCLVESVEGRRRKKGMLTIDPERSLTRDIF